MANGVRRIFISDIHMGDDKSVFPRKPYVWFKNNVPLLVKFLHDQLNARDVKEVVILGDLFDEWIVPADYEPITTLDSICSNATNETVIAELRVLADNGKLVYVPGNHDMAINVAAISKTKQFAQSAFPGIQFICDANMPSGRYEAGNLVAEHGNRYCLFNAPDTWTNPGACFLPLGYFISRMVAYKVSTTGHNQDPHDIFIDFLKKYWEGNPDFIEDLFQAIADDCGLSAESTIELDGISGYGGKMKVGDIGKRFKSLYSNWGHVPGAEQVDAPMAVIGELGNLYEAAASAYLRPGSDKKVIIFGHTHIPDMWKGDYGNSGRSENDDDPAQTPCRAIYANSGTWVDQAACCTYVETEEVREELLYVRVKEYPGDTTISDYQGFIEM